MPVPEKSTAMVSAPSSPSVLRAASPMNPRSMTATSTPAPVSPAVWKASAPVASVASERFGPSPPCA
jgi:hypothetical protein